MHLLYVYILECSDKSYYTGVSNDPDRRTIEHNTSSDRNSYCYTRRPVKCVFVSEPMESSEAIDFEKQVKGWTRKKKEALINDQWELLPELAKSYSKRKKL